MHADSIQQHRLDQAKFANHIFLMLADADSVDYARKKIEGYPLFGIDLKKMSFGDYYAVTPDLLFSGKF